MNRNQEITPHFKLGEFTVSSSYPKLASLIEPTAWQIAAITDWCKTIGEPIRMKYGPVLISRAISSPALERALTKTNSVAPSKTSQHLYGEAVDFQLQSLAPGVTYWDVYEFIHKTLPYWQLIIYLAPQTQLPEYLHVSVRPAQPRATTPIKNALVKRIGARTASGGEAYLAYTGKRVGSAQIV